MKLWLKYLVPVCFIDYNKHEDYTEIIHIFIFFFIFIFFLDFSYSIFPLNPMSIIILLSSLFFILFFFAIWHIPTDTKDQCLKASHKLIGNHYQRKVYSSCFCEYLSTSAFSLLSPSISSYYNIEIGNMIANRCALSYCHTRNELTPWSMVSRNWFVDAKIRDGLVGVNS